ncbi:MAG TPA: D-alanine--D-alanine ligase [Candidatus Coprenecus stercoravium]|uniref:D-alanine--D-alanine ligase n=1 Tax=Candidatus Coprenecus stercoravium TaxID=2840735 RepID=A0A9D2GMP2_9BACT|nr:D-alanine--D-alanine ligase [Candidatus Coprenecus stercoravium]
MRYGKNQNIAVVYGGYSSELEISVQSGKSVAGWLRNAGRNVYEVMLCKEGWWVEGEDGRHWPIDRNDFSCTIDGQRILFDNVFIIIHGDPGENGRLQAYFELIGIPFTGCGSLCASIAFDKYACKTYLRDSGTWLADDIMLRCGETWDAEAITARLGLPVFVKPSNGGSSFGVTKVKNVNDMQAAVEAAFREGDTLIIEKALTGREIDCGVYADSQGVHALPLIEIVPGEGHEFFDYDAKYMGASREICPAPISAQDTAAIQKEAVRIFKRLGCTGLVRMDFILSPDGRPYLLEINPNPGMTAASLVPQMVRQAGMTMEDFLTALIDGR